MPFVAVDDNSNVSAKSPSSPGNFVPVDDNAPSTEPTPINNNSSNDASGIIGTTLGAIASGAMKGGESILNTAQGASNIIGGAMGINTSQDFSDFSKAIETERLKDYGNQQSIHGKVLENLGQLPAMIAMLGTPESVGLLGGKASLEAFAGQAALQAQPQTQGKDLKTQIGSMAWAGGKAAAYGAILGGAMKMGPISGPALAAAYSATTTALEGGDPNDILAGAISGAGLITLSNPKILATVLTAGKGSVRNITEGANNVFNELKTKGPLTATAYVVGDKINNFYQTVKTTMDAQDKIEEIDHNIAGLKNEQQVQNDTLQQDSTSMEALKSQKEQEYKLNTQQGLTSAEQNKSNIVNKVQSIIENKKNQLSNSVNQLSEQLNTGIKNVIFGLKRGGLKNIFNNISDSFEQGLSAIGDQFNATSQKPLTRADLIDAHAAILGKIADANGNIPGGSPVTNELNKNIDFLQNHPLEGNDEKRWQDLKDMGVSKTDIAQQKARANSQIQLSEPVSFKVAKSLFDRAKYADSYGSHEGDMVRETFGELISKKLAENGQDTSQFQKMMGDMSDAISAKKQLARMFSMREGIYSPATSGYNFLEDIARGKGEAGSDGSNMPKLIDVLEKGINIGNNKTTGLGDLTSNLRKMGENLNNVEKEYKSIGSKEKQAISNIGKLFVDRVSQAKNEEKLTQERLNLEHKRVMQLLSDSKDQLNINVAKRMEQLKGDRISQEALLKRKADIGNTIALMGGGMTSYAYAIGNGIRTIGRLVSKKSSGFSKNP